MLCILVTLLSINLESKVVFLWKSTKKENGNRALDESLSLRVTSNCLFCLSDFVSVFVWGESTLFRTAYCKTSWSEVGLPPLTHTLSLSFITPSLLCRSSLFVSLFESENRFVRSIYLRRFALYALCRVLMNMLTNLFVKKCSVRHFILKKCETQKKSKVFKCPRSAFVLY